MPKTELTAERARNLAASIVAHRERVVFAGKYADEIAAALEQLAGLLEQEANAMEALKACQCENCTRQMPLVDAGAKVDAARLLRSQLAASRAHIWKLDRENARLKQEHETGISTRAAMARSLTELDQGNAKLIERLSEARGQLDVAKADLSTEQELVRCLGGEIKRVQGENEILARSRDSWQSQCLEARASADASAERIATLERELAAAKADAGHFRELRRLLIRDRWMLLSMVNVADEGECPDQRFGIELAESNREDGFETLGEAISAAAREGAEHGE